VFDSYCNLTNKSNLINRVIRVLYFVPVCNCQCYCHFYCYFI